MKTKDITLALLFTRGISLATWKKVGNFDREVKLYSELAGHCKKIYFFTYGDKSERSFSSCLPKNIIIIPRPSWIPSNLYVFLMPFIYARVFRSVDIIKTNQMDGSWAGVIAKKIFNKKFLVRCGYEWYDFATRNGLSPIKIWIAKTVERISYRAADKIIITSEADKKFISETFHITSDKITVIPNYIDIERFKPIPVTPEPGRVLFVGRLEPQKNIATLVESLEGLPAHLVVAGSGSLKADAVGAAERTRVSVTFLGNIPQSRLIEEFGKTEVYALPSLHEGNPKSLLEAMAVGLACVGADAKGIREVIAHNETGLLAEPTPEGFHLAIKALLENPELRARLGHNAREYIATRQSLPVTIERELQVYKTLFHEENI